VLWPENIQRGNLCATLLKNSKLNTKKEQIVLKTFRNYSPSNALTINTTSSSSQSYETVPFKNRISF
jgi:hypothetical protein